MRDSVHFLIPETSVDAEVAAVDVVEAPAPVVVQADDRSIAVLPFADLSQDKDQQYFTDGLSEELLNLLVRVDELRVASRTSSFSYRNSSLDIPEISKALNVGHILEGSVRKDGNRIRITAQLIEAGTDTHLWSENFDRELTDIFAIQDEIANAIVNALTGELGMGGERAVTVEVATENLDAYELYLKARELFIARDQLPESIRLFRKAVELDPNFARAWAGLAAVEAVIEEYVFDDGIDHFPLAKEAAETAISLNPDMDLANSGFLDEAMASFQRCIDIDPGYQNCRQHLAAMYLYKGDVAMGVRLHDESLEHRFYANSQRFVSTYVNSGHRNLALLIADREKACEVTSLAPFIQSLRRNRNCTGSWSLHLLASRRR